MNQGLAQLSELDSMACLDLFEEEEGRHSRKEELRILNLHGRPCLIRCFSNSGFQGGILNPQGIHILISMTKRNLTFFLFFFPSKKSANAVDGFWVPAIENRQ